MTQRCKNKKSERNATICIESLPCTLLKTLLDALLPETRRPATSRSKVSIATQGERLILRIMAKDTSALRATINSYLRWVALIQDTYLVAVGFEQADSEKTLN